MALRGLVCMLAPALADAGAPYAGTAMIAGGSGKGPLLSFKANVGNAAFKTDRQPQDLLTWNERTDPCDDRGWESFSNGWAGVMCNAAGGFVTIVDQQFGGVSGDIKELSPLVELRTLNLSENPVSPTRVSTLHHNCSGSGVSLKDCLCLQKVRGSISSLGGLTRLQFLGLYGTSVHGEVSSLSRLRHLGEDWMAPDGTKTCVATGKRQSECQQDGITGRLFLRGTLVSTEVIATATKFPATSLTNCLCLQVSGSVQPLRAIEGLGEQWGPRGGKEFAKDSYTACSAFAPSKYRAHA